MGRQWGSITCGAPLCQRVKAHRQYKYCCRSCSRNLGHDRDCVERNTRRRVSVEEFRRELERTPKRHRR